MQCCGACYKTYQECNTSIPPVNFIKDRVCPGLSVFALKIFTHPVNEVIFKHSLNELMKDIWSDQLVNTHPREMFGKRLRHK